MICECCGEVTEFFMTEVYEECARLASGPCRERRRPIRLDGPVERKNPEMSPSMLSNGLGKQAQIRCREGIAGSLR